MLTQIAINRETGNGRYGDVLDVLEYLQSRYGTASNAAVQCIRESPSYIQAYSALNPKKQHGGRNAKNHK